MNPRPYLLFSAAIFALVAAAHLLRLVLALPVHFGDLEFPTWPSWGGLFVSAALSIWGFRLARR
jgi:hypothetical protein